MGVTTPARFMILTETHHSRGSFGESGRATVPHLPAQPLRQSDSHSDQGFL